MLRLLVHLHALTVVLAHRGATSAARRSPRAHRPDPAPVGPGSSGGAPPGRFGPRSTSSGLDPSGLDSRPLVGRLVGRPCRGDAGQTTAEYALVLLGAAAIAALLITWASKSGAIGKLFDAVLSNVLGSVK